MIHRDETPILASTAARMLRCDARTARTFMRAGVLSHVRAGRHWWTSRAAVHDLIDRLRPPKKENGR